MQQEQPPATNQSSQPNESPIRTVNQTTLIQQRSEEKQI
jgi:hypothetical protein